ncbi:hypothetical protein Tco_0810963 [Tanacetum coccineum]
MTTLQFDDTHNLVSFLAKPAESEGFKQILDFLNTHTIKYALTVNPTIYTLCIEQFWATVKVKTVNGEQQLKALVDGKKIVVTEASVRRGLQLDDEEGTYCLPNATIFEELTRMGYEKLLQKLTFYKAFFSPKWKFLIHTILQCLSAKTTAWNEFSSTMASTIICLATNQKFNFSKYIFESMVKNLDNAGKFLMYPRFIQVFLDNQLEGMSSHKRIYVTPSHTKKIFANMRRKEKSRRSKRQDTEVPQLSDPTNITDEAVHEEPSMQLKELMDFCTKLQQRVLDLENTKTAQAQEITISSKEASLGDQEDVSKQGRKIDDIDKDAKITLVDETQGRYGDEDIFGVNDLDGDEVVVESEVTNKAGEKRNIVEEVVVVTDAITIPVSADTITNVELTLAQTLAELKSERPKTKGVVMQEPSKSTPTISLQLPSQVKGQGSKDKGKAKMIELEKPLKKKDQIKFDEEEALRLQAKFDEEDRLTREKAQQVEEANIAWDDIQAKIDADYQLAERLQAQEQQELTIKEKSTLFVQLLEKRKKHFAAKRAEEKRNRSPTRVQQRSIMCTYLKNMAGCKPKDLKNKSFSNIQEVFDKAFKRVNTFVDFRIELVEGSEVRAEGSETREEISSKRAGDELQQQNAKKQKVDDDQEVTKMKELMKIVPDEEEVAVNAILLATKPPSIMLRSFDKEDLKTLWKLVKAKHGYIRPEEGYERVLWGDLKTITELVEGTEMEESSKKAENAKKQKVDDDQEAAKMKELMKIIPDEEEVAVDAIPLATKPPSICGGIYGKTKCWFGSYLIPVEYTLCGFKICIAFIWVEKRYPLTPATITDMLNKKLQADQWNEMYYQLLS